MIIVGHSHEQFLREANGACFVNPGSVGRPGDGNSQTAYAILSFNPFKVELIRLDYDVEAAAEALRRKGLPESFAQMLLTRNIFRCCFAGGQDQKEHDVKIAEKLQRRQRLSAQKYWPDTEHSTQVTTLALQFFDGLSECAQVRCD